jgi:PAP2 superfamily
VGAAILIVAASYGLRRGLQMVGACLTAYYIALFLFYLLPSLGPYLTDAGHFRSWPLGSIYTEQATGIAELTGPKSALRADYFIGFPCMHIVKPAVSAWFLRKRGWLGWFFAGYTVLLIPVIFVLDQHYLVDVLGGAALIPISICAVGGFDRQKTRDLS